MNAGGQRGSECRHDGNLTRRGAVKIGEKRQVEVDFQGGISKIWWKMDEGVRES